MNRTGVILAGLLLLLPASVSARMRVQSGEHAAYSRLVFPLGPGMKWRLKWLGDRYELRFAPRPGRINLSDVFRFIPRTRLKDIVARPDLPGVILVPAPRYHARAVEIPPGYLVVDFRAGPAHVGERGTLVTPGRARAVMMGPPWSAQRKVAAGKGSPDFRQPLPTTKTQTDPGQKDPYPRSRRIEASSTRGGKSKEAGIFMPDIRLMTARAHLLAQLRNAQSEGIILPGLDKARGLIPPEGTAPARGGDPGTDSPGPDNGRDARRNLSIRSVFESSAAKGSAPDIARLRQCPGDDKFRLPPDPDQGRKPVDLGAWRTGVVKDIDQVDAGKLENMARFLISRRMGMEAETLLSSYSGTLADASLLADMAKVVETGTGTPNGPLTRYLRCPGKAGIWAIFSRPDLTSTSYTDGNTLLDDFAALPGGLRHILGPGLIARLRKAGALQLASGIAMLTRRAPGPETVEYALEKARLDLSMGRVQQARTALVAIARGRSSHAPEAMALFLESGLKEGVAAAPGVLDDAAYQAFSLRFSPLGVRLRKAEILQRALGQKQGEAFDILVHEARVGALSAKTTRRIAAGIFRSFSLEQLDPGRFVELFFRFRRLLGIGQMFDDARRQVARALIKSGLPAVALEVLSPLNGRETPADRLIRSRALIDLGRSRAALRLLDRMTSARARALRSQALMRIGQFGRAVSAQRGTTDDRGLQQAAWRAGRWDIVRKGGDALRRQAAIYAGRDSGDSTGGAGNALTFDTHLRPPEKPQLSGLRGLLKASRQSRATIEALLRQNPQP